MFFFSFFFQSFLKILLSKIWKEWPGDRWEMGLLKKKEKIDGTIWLMSSNLLLHGVLLVVTPFPLPQYTGKNPWQESMDAWLGKKRHAHLSQKVSFYILLKWIVSLYLLWLCWIKCLNSFFFWWVLFSVAWKA